MQEIRPPFIKFEQRAVEDRGATLASGVYTTKDVDYIIVIPHGSEGKLVIEQPYADWLVKIRPQVSGDLRAPGAGADVPLMAASRFPPEWLEKIERAYEAWKKGIELPVEGTPVDNWPVLSPAQRLNCKQMHIRTVEELAEATDEACGAVGIGGITIRERARAWVKAQQGDASKLSAEFEKLKASMQNLEMENAKLREQMATAKKAA